MMKDVPNDQIEFYMIQIGCPCGASGKESACQCKRGKRHGFDPWVGKIPCRRKLQPIPVYLPGKSHGQRSLVNWKESDMASIAQANDINWEWKICISLNFRNLLYSIELKWVKCFCYYWKDYAQSFSNYSKPEFWGFQKRHTYTEDVKIWLSQCL